MSGLLQYWEYLADSLGKTWWQGDKSVLHRMVLLEKKLQTLLASCSAATPSTIWSQPDFLARTPAVGAKIASLEVCESWHTPGVTRGNWKWEYGQRNMISLHWISTISCLFWAWVMFFYYLRVAILHSFLTHFVGVKATNHHKQSWKILLKYQTLQNFPPISSYKTLYEQEGRKQPQDNTWVKGLPHGYI